MKAKGKEEILPTHPSIQSKSLTAEKTKGGKEKKNALGVAEGVLRHEEVGVDLAHAGAEHLALGAADGGGLQHGEVDDDVDDLQHVVASVQQRVQPVEDGVVLDVPRVGRALHAGLGLVPVFFFFFFLAVVFLRA